MLTKLREPFGKAGLIVAIVALIAALGGGAYAASGGLSGKQKKEVEKIAKKYAGKNGTNGINGTNGTPGAKGETGAAGSNGTNGTNGSPGGRGASVTETTIHSGEPACKEQGGAEYLLEGATEGTKVCNGSPWAAGGTLPKGATETGAWGFNASEASAKGTFPTNRIIVPFTFPIPLSAPIEGAANVHFAPFNGNATCKGNYLEPSAPEGMVCFYETEVLNATFGGVRGLEASANNEVNTAGGFLVFNEVKDHAEGLGSYAVTGK